MIANTGSNAVVSVEVIGGEGVGAMSVTKTGTYSNTFPVDEYIKATKDGLAVAMGTTFLKEESMMQWFMMRLYENRFERSEFVKNFGIQPEEGLKIPLKIFQFLKIVESNKDAITVAKEGLYPVHLMTKTFVTQYIGKICLEGMSNPWPATFKV